jgi:ribosomal protein L7/L12
MQELDPQLYWLILAAVAYGAFLFGRTTARRGEAGMTREERRRRETDEAAAALSALEPSKLADVDRLLTRGKIIEALRLVRTETGMGLYQSKLAIDQRRAVIKGG